MTAAQLNALATIALTDNILPHTAWKTRWQLQSKGLIEVRPAAEPIRYHLRGGMCIYRLTDAGRTLAETAPFWKAAQHLIAQGFEINTERYCKPRFVPFRRIGTEGRRSGDTAWISGGRDAWQYFPAAEPRYENHHEAQLTFPTKGEPK